MPHTAVIGKNIIGAYFISLCHLGSIAEQYKLAIVPKPNPTDFVKDHLFCITLSEFFTASLNFSA